MINQIVNADCLQVMQDIPDKSVDLVLTDPPYPDYHVDKYKYHDGILEIFNKFQCKQIIFWSAKAKFPLSYTAIHIWDKKCGVGSMYERIFERFGCKNYRVYNHYLINSTVAANYTNEVFYGHPSQKPIKLLCQILEHCSKEGDLVLDPFAGVSSTAIACKRMDRRFIMIEQDADYCEIGRKRLKAEKSMFDKI